MDEQAIIYIDGDSVSVRAGTILVVALAEAGIERFRRSPEGHCRAPLCGMGTCFECTVTIDGQQHQRSCQSICTPGMRVETAHG